jgi:UDP-N-acetylmuramoyl-tripeptide--D-alanyl-D-alanine ligase
MREFFKNFKIPPTPLELGEVLGEEVGLKRSVAELAREAGGVILSGDPGAPAGAVTTDTRAIGAGDCFIALIGENHDGHDFAARAIEMGAGALIVSRWDGVFPDRCAVIKVSDTLFALGELARRHRNRFDIPVVAISGSNGKTSTKEMVHAIFARTRKVLKNRGNFNNLIGLPITLLKLTDEYDMAVVEMGINVFGEMDRLSEIGSPTVGIITNVHPAHLQGLESQDRIAEEKGKLWKSLRPGGLAVVNLDDPRLSRLAEDIDARKITFSLTNPAADVSVCSDVVVSEAKTSFSIRFQGAEIAVTLPIMGIHHAQNALAACAAALGSGATAEEVQAGLADFEPVRQRMNCRRLENGCVLIDDTYNANPRSMLAAVEAVLAASSGRPFAAVLGEMRELGDQGPALHFELGKRIGAAKPSILITLGQLGIEIIRGAQAAGMDHSSCHHAKSHDEAVNYLLEKMPERAWVLVKGSRGMTMEHVVEGLMAMGKKCNE